MSGQAAPRMASPLGEALAPPFVWAHRGASALEPENTLAAFARAAELAADGIELDVQLSADGVAIVVHDPVLYHDGAAFHLRRPAGVDARPVFVGTVDAAELTGEPVVFPDGRRARLARLEEVLAGLPAWMWLDVELKAGWVYDARLTGVVASLLRARPERCLVSSFDHVVLAEMCRHAPDVPRAALCDARLVDAVAVLASVPAEMWNVRRAFVTRDDVVALRERGVGVSVYGEEVRYQMAELSTWPLAGVFLDDPRDGRAVASEVPPSAPR